MKQISVKASILAAIILAVLIMGGADKGLNMEKLIHALPEYTKKVILLSDESTTGSIMECGICVLGRSPGSREWCWSLVLSLG